MCETVNNTWDLGKISQAVNCITCKIQSTFRKSSVKCTFNFRDFEGTIVFLN